MGYFFYKNIAFVMTLFWFSLTNGYSAQALFDSGYQVRPTPRCTAPQWRMSGTLEGEGEGEGEGERERERERERAVS